ncbi:MAG: KEOPS complex subunit Pcc1 [Candidatus Thorarchaeota archaeon]|jgi:KEOPS complex subunit Pcc1
MIDDRIVKAQASLLIDVDDSKLVDVLYSAIKPETESVSSDRATAHLTKEGNQLQISIDASDLTALRASMNSYLAWISGSIRAVESVTGQNP